MALTLSEYDVQYPPKHKMPKEQGGFRLCKLIQYPERTDEDGTIRPQSEWLMTTAFSTTMEWKGITISASVWSRGETNIPRKEEVSLWLNGASDEALLKLVEDNIGYVYMHESLTMLPMTVSEYEEYLSKNIPNMKKASTITADAVPAQYINQYSQHRSGGNTWPIVGYVC